MGPRLNAGAITQVIWVRILQESRRNQYIEAYILHFFYNQKYVPTLKRSVQHVLFPQIFGSWEASFLENKTVLILSSRSTIFGVRSCMEESLQTCTWLYVTKHGGKIMIVESLPCCWSFWVRSKNKCHENYFSLSFSMEVEMAHGFSKACKNVLSSEHGASLTGLVSGDERRRRK